MKLEGTYDRVRLSKNFVEEAIPTLKQMTSVTRNMKAVICAAEVHGWDNPMGIFAHAKELNELTWNMVAENMR